MKGKTMRESEQGTDIHCLVEVNWVGGKDKGIHFPPKLFPPKLKGNGENIESGTSQQAIFLSLSSLQAKCL